MILASKVLVLAKIFLVSILLYVSQLIFFAANTHQIDFKRGNWVYVFIDSAHLGEYHDLTTHNKYNKL